MAQLLQIARLAGLLSLGLLLLGMSGWGVLALYYFDHLSAAMRTGLAVAFGIASIVVLVGFVLPRWRWRAFAAYLVLFALVLSWWSTFAPSNERDWQPEGAILPYATIAGDIVTVHNIRNFDYRTETDFTPAYYDKTFDLRQLDSADLVVTYWMGPTFAHVFLSFGFAGKDHLAISIEARKERSESYSTLQGFFRQYELQYVVADERDVIRVRTNYRRDPPEEVHLYRLKGKAQEGRRLFLEHLHKINSLKEHAEFYNSLTTNCTSNIWIHERVNPGHVQYSWKILLSGHVPEYLYESGVLDTSLPFAELQRRSHINELAQAADKAEDFSMRIRAMPVTAMPASETGRNPEGKAQ
ncbi:MAG: DUF4105 domain-containing protein [Gallionella sp.]